MDINQRAVLDNWQNTVYQPGSLSLSICVSVLETAWNLADCYCIPVLQVEWIPLPVCVSLPPSLLFLSPCTGRKHGASLCLGNASNPSPVSGGRIQASVAMQKRAVRACDDSQQLERAVAFVPFPVVQSKLPYGLMLARLPMCFTWHFPSDGLRSERTCLQWWRRGP